MALCKVHSEHPVQMQQGGGVWEEVGQHQMHITGALCCPHFKPTLSSGHELGNTQEMLLKFCSEDTNEMDSISPPVSLRILPLPAVILVESGFATKEQIIIIIQSRKLNKNKQESEKFLGWKRFLRSNPSMNPAFPGPPGIPWTGRCQQQPQGWAVTEQG